MRLLRINDTIVDIDENTAFGITLQSYDIKDMAKSFVNVSNTFSIPKTSNNLSIFGNAQDSQSISTLIYELATCNYWVENEQFLKDAKVKVTEINGRINLFIYQKETVWDLMKNFYWKDLGAELLTWLQATKSYPTSTTPDTGTYSDFINKYASTTEGLFLPFYFSNAYGTASENISQLFLNDEQSDEKGGHICVYVKTIFEFFEYKFDVNFLTSGGVKEGNIWDDEIAKQIYIPIRDIIVRENAGFYFNFKGAISTDADFHKFPPFGNLRDKPSKNASDFINAFIQHFNLIKDEFYIDGIYTVRFARFDDLENVSTIEDWSGKIKSVKSFKPTIDGFAQNSYIKFKGIYPEGNEFLNSKKLTVNNKNIDVNSDILNIDAYVPDILENHLALNLSNSFETFVFMISEIATTSVLVYFYDLSHNFYATTVNLKKASLYNLDGEYNFFNDSITYPKCYEIEKHLTLADIKEFEFFKQYYVRHLNGSFFVNKIKGFNPEKTKQATTIELLKVSNRTPLSLEDLDVWVDGMQDIWVDGSGNYFY